MHVWHMGVFKIFWNKAVFGCRKTFSGKYIFSGNANFRKRKIFPYVWLHFKKFSGKYFLMFGKEEGKDKPKKNIINDRDPRSRSRRHDLAINGASSRRRDLGRRRDRDQLRDLAKVRLRSTLREIAPLIVISVEGEIAINCTILRQREIAPSIARSRSSWDRAVDRDLRGDRRTGDRRRLELRVRRRSSDWLFGFFSSLARARSLSLSLSLFFRKCFEVKMRGENHFRVKGENISQPEVIFRKISFSVTAKHAGLGENVFRKWFSPKTNTA